MSSGMFFVLLAKRGPSSKFNQHSAINGSELSTSAQWKENRYRLPFSLGGLNGRHVFFPLLLLRSISIVGGG